MGPARGLGRKRTLAAVRDRGRADRLRTARAIAWRGRVDAAVRNRAGLALNDDALWAVIASVHAWNGDHDPALLDYASDTYRRLVTTYWDDRCQGGLWWDPARSYKNAITNELLLYASTQLYLATGQQAYRDWALRVWSWISQSSMIGRDGMVNDGLNASCRNNGQPYFTYNQGVLIGGLTDLTTITGDLPIAISRCERPSRPRACSPRPAAFCANRFLRSVRTASCSRACSPIIWAICSMTCRLARPCGTAALEPGQCRSRMASQRRRHARDRKRLVRSRVGHRCGVAGVRPQHPAGGRRIRRSRRTPTFENALTSQRFATH
jgi:hypothetical protein